MGSKDVMSRLRTIVADELGEQKSVPPAAAGSLEEALERIAHLEVAVEHQRVIGQATGLVMERFGLDADTALGVLRRVSQERNRKLHAVAVELVGDGHSEGL